MGIVQVSWGFFGFEALFTNILGNLCSLQQTNLSVFILTVEIKLTMRKYSLDFSTCFLPSWGTKLIKKLTMY